MATRVEHEAEQHGRLLEDEFHTERHVYEPHKAGLPPMRSYLHELWRRRQFAFEMARTTLRAQNFNTALGQLWLLLNPLLLTCVYFLLVTILRDHSRGSVFFAHLMAGLFAYNFISTSLNQAGRSVTKGGRLVLNTAFPRTLLPLSAVLVSFLRFLPTLGIYAVMATVAHLPFGPHLLWAIPVFAIIAMFTAGMAMLIAALHVYFRDISSFLPYVMRIWLYASPILYYVEEVPDRYKPLIYANPLTPLLGSWSDVLILARAPRPGLLLMGAAWAFGALIVGMLFFISREREFAVRL
jgi:teichoic acid transport system permease protein